MHMDKVQRSKVGKQVGCKAKQKTGNKSPRMEKQKMYRVYIVDREIRVVFVVEASGENRERHCSSISVKGNR